MPGRMVLSSSFSRHFIIMDVRATGQLWLGSVGHGFLGAGIIVAVFKRVGGLAVQ